MGCPNIRFLTLEQLEMGSHADWPVPLWDGHLQYSAVLLSDVVDPLPLCNESDEGKVGGLVQVVELDQGAGGFQGLRGLDLNHIVPFIQFEEMGSVGGLVLNRR